MTMTDEERRESKRAASRRHYERNRESIIAASLDRYYADPEAAKQKHRDWYAANKDRHNVLRRRWKAAHPERVRYLNRRAHVMREYKLTLGELDDMAAQQGGRCAICREEKPIFPDHDHDTGRVRGLLCFNCNVAIGHLRDDPKLLEAAIAYLVFNQQ